MTLRTVFRRHCLISVSPGSALILVTLGLLAARSPLFGSEIHDAAMNGDAARVTVLLKGDPKLVSEKDAHGMTPLHWAASTGHKDVASVLVANGANVNARNADGDSPLLLCVKMHNVDVAAVLLTNLADANARDVDGGTPLHKAASMGYRDVAKLLLAYKADVNSRDRWGSTPLMIAANTGHKDVAELLLANGANINLKDDDGSTALHWAALNGDRAMTELLIEKHANLNAKDNRGRTPLQKARANAEVAKLLRQRGGQPGLATPQSNDEMIEAVHANDLKKVKTLLNHNPQLVFTRDHRGDTPLHWAAEWGCTEVADFLLERKADVEARDRTGWTPLHFAASFGHSSVAALLLNNNANVNAKDDHGFTPLHYTAMPNTDPADGAIAGVLPAKAEALKEVGALLRSHGARE